jgi:hypothetical protein
VPSAATGAVFDGVGEGLGGTVGAGLSAGVDEIVTEGAVETGAGASVLLVEVPHAARELTSATVTASRRTSRG